MEEEKKGRVWRKRREGGREKGREGRKEGREGGEKGWGRVGRRTREGEG